MKDIAFFNETFNINKTTTYFLSLQLSEICYSYCIIDIIKNRYEAIKHVNFEEELLDKTLQEKVTEMLKKDAFLNRHYKKVSFSYVSRQASVVPTELFKKENINELFLYNHELTDGSEIHYNKLPEVDANNIFSIPSGITVLLVNRFPEIRFYHHSTPMIRAAALYVHDKKIRNAFVQINASANFYDILILDANKLILFNTFTATQDIDLVYHILNLMQQLKLRIQTTDFVISGEIENESELVNTLKRYIPSIQNAQFGGRLNYNFNEAPENLFMNLLNLHQCE